MSVALPNLYVDLVLLDCVVDGPLRNISDSTLECVNITTIRGDQLVRLDASGIFEDPGNPTSTVKWTWENRSQAITVGTSGMLDGIPSQRVTRTDNNHVIVARYHNVFGSTMQQFILCVNCEYLTCQ